MTLSAFLTPPTDPDLPVPDTSTLDANVVAVCRHKYGGVLYLEGQTYRMDPARVSDNVARGLVYALGSATVDWWGAPGRVLAAEPADGARPYATSPTPGALKIAAGVGYDPGAAAFRLHSAINEHSQHASAFVRWGHTNPHCDLRQYDGIKDAATVRQAILDADVLHCHVNYTLLGNAGLRPRPGQLLVRHYHGSRPDGGSWPKKFQREDDALGAVLVGARLQLCEESPRMRWLPIPVPVARYRTLRAAHALPGEPGVDRPFRIAHSPTKRRIKGSDAFDRAVAALRRQGLAVEPVVIQGKTLAEALVIKASCDALFDSFWLGIQGSGLEAGAMGLPVIAGDLTAATLVQQACGHVPYTFADDEAALTRAIERLATDPVWRAEEADRVSAYVETFHDYPAVARRYEAILSEALERDVTTPARPDAPRVAAPPVPVAHDAPAPQAPARKRPKRQRAKTPETR